MEAIGLPKVSFGIADVTQGGQKVMHKRLAITTDLASWDMSLLAWAHGKAYTKIHMAKTHDEVEV